MICILIRFALRGKHTLVSVDEKTSMQALERKVVHRQGGLYMESEYKRNGTTCLIAGLDIKTGKIIAPLLRDTRKEKDFLDFVKTLVASYSEKQKIIILADNLNTHVSVTLTEWVAQQIKFEGDLGKRKKRGILKNQASRREFLMNRKHRIRFIYTPKHCSWLNPIENWFAKLQKKVLRGQSFTSKKDLIEQIKGYISYYNKVWAKPIQWNFKGFDEIPKYHIE